MLLKVLKYLNYYISLKLYVNKFEYPINKPYSRDVDNNFEFFLKLNDKFMIVLIWKLAIRGLFYLVL